MDDDVPVLADPERAVRRLVLDRRVPPSVEVHDVRRRGQVQTDATRLQREHEERDEFVVLEGVDEFLPPADRGAAVEHEAGPPEDARERLGEWSRDLAELREHEDLLAAGGDLGDDLEEAQELAALLGREGLRTRPLGGMIADLLQPHEVRENEAPPVDPRDLPDPVREFVDRLPVERRLTSREGAVGRHLGLVREVGNDASVGLEAAEEVGADEGTHPPEVGRRRALQGADEVRERRGRTEEAGIQKVEERPEIAEVVLDRCSGQGDPGVRLQGLDRPSLPGPRVLDRLGFVQHDQAERGLGDPRHARERPIGRDHEVAPARDPGAFARDLRDRLLRGVGHVDAQARGKALDLRAPVADERGRDDEQGGLPARTPLPREEEREDLERLPEPHVVGEACAETEFGHEREPCRADPLIRAERRPEAVGRGPGLAVSFAAQTGEGLLEPRSGTHPPTTRGRPPRPRSATSHRGAARPGVAALPRSSGRLGARRFRRAASARGPPAAAVDRVRPSARGTSRVRRPARGAAATPPDRGARRRPRPGDRSRESRRFRRPPEHRLRSRSPPSDGTAAGGATSPGP